MLCVSVYELSTLVHARSIWEELDTTLWAVLACCNYVKSKSLVYKLVGYYAILRWRKCKTRSMPLYSSNLPLTNPGTVLYT